MDKQIGRILWYTGLVILAASGMLSGLSCGGGDFAAPSPSGTLTMTAATTGSSFDPDGYAVSMDGGAAQPIGINASLTLPDVAAGDHSVALAGLASNCTAAEANPQTVTVPAGTAASVDFTVTCTSAEPTHWTAIPVPSDFIASALWASSPSDIFVAGSYGTTDNRAVLHYDGHDWTEQLTGYVVAVWGSSPTDVFATGGGRVWHYNGAGWLVGDTGQHDADYLAIWGTSPQDVFAVGVDNSSNSGGGLLVHYDGAGWNWIGAAGYDGGYPYDVSGSSPTDVYAVGYQPAAEDTPPELFYEDYRVLHYDGRTWSRSFQVEVHIGPYNSFILTGVWAIAQDNVFVVGAGGHIYHFDGSAWSPMTSPTTQNLADVWGNTGSNVYAVGDGGILRYNGTSWRVMNTTAGLRVWGAGTDVFVIRKDGGAVLHGTP